MFYAFSIFRIPAIKARECYRQQIRPKDDYYYFWMLGVLDEGKGRGAARELKNTMFQKADAEGLPIYAETSMESNCRVYEWMGFELYHFWEVEQKDIRFWFMKREPAAS
jgi:GNAT superfamily N-acetyltransferase